MHLDVSSGNIYIYSKRCSILLSIHLIPCMHVRDMYISASQVHQMTFIWRWWHVNTVAVLQIMIMIMIMNANYYVEGLSRTFLHGGYLFYWIEGRVLFWKPTETRLVAVLVRQVCGLPLCYDFDKKTKELKKRFHLKISFWIWMILIACGWWKL